jgi:hypothetical protein
MARYNSSLASTTISGTHTISSPNQGAFTNLAGTAPYTVTLPSPVLFPGSNQTFYNATGGTVTLSTPSGILTGTGGSNASTVLCFAGNVLSVTSDGTNYVVISEDGSALVATTGSFSGDVAMNGSGATVSLTPQTVTITPSSTSNINNMNIGATTRGSGAFTSLAANAAVAFTANTASTTTGNGTLVVTGGVGVSGQLTATSVSATNLTGTIQTAAQANITSTGGLTAPTLILNPGTGIGVIRRSAVNGSNGVRIQGNAADTVPNDANAGAYIQLGGGVIGDTYEGNVDIVAYGGNVDANRNQIRFSNRSGTDTITERMRINKDGNVGIGITAPTSKLFVADPGTTLPTGNSAGTGFSVGRADGLIGLSIGYLASNQSSYLQSKNFTNTDMLPLLLNPSGGNVGIGTTDFSAGYTFNVAKTARFNGMMLGNGDGSNSADNRILINWSSGTEALIIAQQNVPLKLGVAGSAKVALDSGGHWIPLTNDTQNLGSATAAWANIYTNDLHLNNETKVNGNDVDGTTGNWTIQEGAENLYIINNKTGKKYAFALREIE